MGLAVVLIRYPQNTKSGKFVVVMEAVPPLLLLIPGRAPFGSKYELVGAFFISKAFIEMKFGDV